MATHHITQSGAGDQDGSSLANAWSAADFNTIGNWSATPATSGQISPGDTVVLNGTISTVLVIQRSGQEENRTTLLFAAGAKMSAPFFPNTGAINIENRHYITVDGGDDGIIECTDNGTAGDYTTQVGSRGVYVFGSNHVHVRNLRIRTLYVRTSLTDTAAGGQGIRFASLSSGSYTGAKAIGNTISDCNEGISCVFRTSGTDFEIADNTIFDINDGITLGAGGPSNICNGALIHGNRIHSFYKWDDTTSSNKYHHDGIHVFATHSGSSATGVRTFNNFIGAGYGSRATSGIYYSGHIVDSYIYNNRISGDPDNPGNGLITLQVYSGDVGVYNNTIYAAGTSFGRAIHHNNQTQPGFEVTVKNNLIVTVAFAQWIIWRDTGTRIIDRNLYHNLGGGFNWSAGSSQSVVSWETWQGLGFDENGLFGQDPLLTEDFELSEGSPAIGAGENLSAIFTTDAAGETRPSEGAWDIGAFQFGSEAPPPPPPDPDPPPDPPPPDPPQPGKGNRGKGKGRLSVKGPGFV